VIYRLNALLRRGKKDGSEIPVLCVNLGYQTPECEGVAWPGEVCADACVPFIKSIEERKTLTCLARCSITNLQARVDFHDYFYTFIQ